MPQDKIEVLLVDDNSSDVELAIHTLRQEKLADRIHVARDGEEALDFLFCRGSYAGRSFDMPPRLVLLDLKLPKVDGLAVLRQLKTDDRTRGIPVAMLTSSRETPDLIRSYRLGVNSYVLKPINFDQFRETIRQLGLYWLFVNQPMPCDAFSQ